MAILPEYQTIVAFVKTELNVASVPVMIDQYCSRLCDYIFYFYYYI